LTRRSAATGLEREEMLAVQVRVAVSSVASRIDEAGSEASSRYLQSASAYEGDSDGP
jgi:hypothetical protein